MTDDNTLECATHGKAYVTYICGHLHLQPLQEWYCDYPSKDNPWPDAWCADCDKAFLEFGEWNDENSDCIDGKVICNNCYEDRKGSSVAPLMEARKATWEPLISEATEQLKAKQKILAEQFSLAKHERWDWDQETSEITFSNNGKPAVTARIQFVGSVSTTGGTWLWSWANEHVNQPVFEDILRLREFGDEHDYPNLTTPLWPADEADGWEMTALAAMHLSADGAYRTPSNTGFTFMVLSGVKLI